MSHLDEGTLHALLDGELETAEVREIQLHLGTCAACGSRLQDVKQFLEEADRLVETLDMPASAGHAPIQPPPPPPPPPMWEPPPSETPVLLLPDSGDAMERRRRWMRRLQVAAVVVVVLGVGRVLNNTIRPHEPMPPDRDLTSVSTAPSRAVVSPEESRPPEPRAAKAAAKPARPATRPPATKPAPEPAVLADEQPTDSALDQVDTAAAAAADDTIPPPTQMAAARQDSEASQQVSEEDALATRRAAAAALAELDRERLRARANAATAALPPPKAEAPAPAEAPPPRRTMEQRAEVYLRIGLDEASKQLGRPVHVIEAMTPEFIGLAQGRAVPGADPARPVVRVVYLDSRGRLIMLDQQRMRTGQAPGGPSGSLRWTLGDVMLYLHGDPGADVLRGIQRRVR